MSQRTTSAHTFLSFFYQRPLFVQGLSWIGSVGLLSSGMVLAQTPSNEAIAPSSQDSQPTAMEAAPAVELAPVAPAPDPIAPEFAPETAPPPAAAEFEPEPQPIAAPVEPAPVAPFSSDTANAPTPVEPNHTYIDRTDYSIGATRSYDEPTAVVLSERSSGCQQVLRTGQGVAGGLCGTAAQSQVVASTWTPPSSWSAPTASSGGTRSWQAPPAAGVNTVNIGPIRFSSSGISVGSTTAAGRAYYNRTVRPPGRLGNGNISFIFPLPIPVAITSVFGWRTHPITGDRRFHSGTDLGAPLGTPVLAAYAGKVAIADVLGGYGLAVSLEHNKGTQETLYAHLSEIFVKPGEVIKQGDVIGRVGSTGNSTGPHLHFEFRQLTEAGWVAMDPGTQLEYALAQLVKALQTAQAKPKPQA